MQVTVSLTVQVPSTATFEEIQEACVQASRRAAREAMGQILRRMEHARGRRARGSHGGRRRTIPTRCGYLTITRGRARRDDGTRYFPLDERLGLAPHHEASPFVRRRGLELAACHPYREAARLPSAEVGAHVDHRAIWRWVQADGDAKLRARAERVQAMFGQGEAPPRPDRAVPGRLSVAVDATGIRLIEGEGASVKLGPRAATVPVGIGSTTVRPWRGREASNQRPGPSQVPTGPTSESAGSSVWSTNDATRRPTCPPILT